MALLDDVKSELSAIDNELPIAKKAQATAMIRFGNGLHSVDHHILVQVQLDSQDAATWLQDLDNKRMTPDCQSLLSQVYLPRQI